MDGHSNPTTTRRSLLTAIEAGLAFESLTTRGTVAPDAYQYLIVQGNRCVPVRPPRGQSSIEMFYEY